jgi:lipoprotein-anchoring transpeptidase ErfK/SrfK
VTTVLAATLRFLRRNAVRLGVVLGSFVFVAGLIVVQQAREVLAENAYQAQRAGVLADQQRASDLGLQSGEFSDLERLELTTSSAVPPQATPPFNEARIAFFNRQARDEAGIKSQLESRINNLLDQTRGAAEKDVTTLAAQLQKAQQVGVDAQLLVDFAGLPSEAQIELDDATTVVAYRAISTQLAAPLSKLSLLISDQQQTNQLIAQYAAQIAQQDHGDVNLAKSNAYNALKQIQADLHTAGIFRMDVSVVSTHVSSLTGKLSASSSLNDYEQVNGALLVQDKVLQDAMSQNLPAKAITISLTEQVLRAYDHGKQVFWSYVTTGRPGLETDPGYFKVYWKVSPWTMHSPWPRSSPNWYPDSKVQMVMWFNGGDGIHDASWRSVYGPGTEYPHYDPTGEDVGTHGCVNVPYGNMVWLWNWTPTGTPVIVYQQ